ncbi:MAG: CBS domain-containing protein [Methanothrix sp.]|nr:CBS domain-containing protein [Methanothrix sp.]
MINTDLSMELTLVQRDILTTLINIYRTENRAVKGEEIAELTDRHPGTIRNQMQSLKALNLVEGIPGPKGGYKATISAYEALNLDATGDVVTPIMKNGIVVDGITASEIVFDKVMKSHECSGSVRVIGNIKGFNVGDEIRIGPTPMNKLYIRGNITGKDITMSQLIFDVTEIISVPRIPVKEVGRRAVRIDANATIQEAARILIRNGVREALVNESSPGLVSMIDIARAIADGRTDLKVSEISSHSFLTVDSKEPISEAVNILGRNDLSQLVVSDSGVLWGIITPADLVRVLKPHHGLQGISLH